MCCPLQILTLNICNQDKSISVIVWSFKLGEQIEDVENYMYLVKILSNSHLIFFELLLFANFDFANW